MLAIKRPHLLSQQTIIIMPPHPIIEISELAQVIVDHCLILGNKQSLVSLACTCRALEEQALSTLWSVQSSLATLIKSTLPPGIFPPSKPLPHVRFSITIAAWFVSDTFI
jgi:hypothetical protein